jgi:hypothetical protein
MSESVSHDPDQRCEPEHHVAEVNERDVRDEIRLERAIKIEKDKKNDDRNEPDPELLLLGSIVCHVRRLVVCPK